MKKSTPPTSPAVTRPDPAPRKRARGRRPTAESADLRATLLDAALACFVRKGIAASSLRDIASEAHVTPALVAAFVNGITRAVAAHPWLPTLWVREILCEGGALREVMIERIGPLLPQLLAERFTAAQRAGQLKPRLDPRLMVVSMVGLTMFPLASAPIWQQLFGTGELGADVVQRHALALLTQGLELEHG